ncbi:hypothetical protein HDA32_001189 [Spinactinospora alkalitolerans]|uniref:3-methyladenine DNA glycosylase n=1 Tax=Spinactinospora alkalitolerans TaxID=687207 RepID=A0A852TQ04_9ACTN|nr:3-methyladenine DNA glycosylase [Spinactinospora alkalitolerans]NYE46069.1 hypothetical protein [Spinactinospora alkalitolerans]
MSIGIPAAAGWRVLEQARWREREARHHERADALLAGHLERRRLGAAHPVEDFLFTYYSHKPGRLRRWHPGAGAVLLGEAALDRLDRRWYREFTVPDPRGGSARGVGLDAEAFYAERGATVDFVSALLRAVNARPAHLGCFGLHEWAMVYRLSPEQVRHARVPLRLGSEGTDRVVESHRVHCSHYDAFRFFTPEARPLNRLRPTRRDQVDQDQPGCLHATMDCYKWAYKLTPAVPGELVLDCFELARDVRELDMRASPYDLSGHGYSPVRIETAEGKAEYMAAQKEFAERGTALRSRLLEVCEALAGGPARGGRSR